MTACATCQKPIENEAFSGILCQSCFAKDQQKLDASRGGLLSKIPIAVVLGLIPFFISFRTASSSSVTINDQVVQQSARAVDYVAVTLGPLAIVFGILALVAARKGPAATRTRSLVLAALGILLGALQLYRGVS